MTNDGRATSNRVWRIYSTRPSDFKRFSVLLIGTAKDAQHEVERSQKRGFIHYRYELDTGRAS